MIIIHLKTLLKYHMVYNLIMIFFFYFSYIKLKVKKNVIIL
jgi:hypothetical protein